MHSVFRPAALALGVVAWFAAAGAAAESLPRAVDLQDDGRRAAAERQPVVLFFRSQSCPFCREVEELYLAPRQRDAAATPRILLRIVDVDGAAPLVAFDGRRTDHAAFARAQQVRLVPHLRFVGPDGQTLAPDLIGISSRDFYGGYLEDAIRAASDRLQRQ
jgi:thioredoxin-related protein